MLGPYNSTGGTLNSLLQARSELIFFILGATIFVAASALPVIPWRMAVGFVGPEAYVWMKSSLWPSLSDFATSALAYDASLVMLSYVWSAEWFGLSPTHLAGLHVILQALFFTYAAWRLGFVLSGSRTAAMVVCSVILISHLTGANLGRFGDGLQSSIHALYYGYANAFSMMALTYRFEQRHLPSAFALLVCGLAHPTIGLYTGLFLALTLWAHPPRLPDLRSLWPYGATALTMAIWVLANIPPDLETAVPAEAFIRATRTFSAHWHPLQLQIFTRGFYGNTAPLLFALAVLTVAIPALTMIHTRRLSGALIVAIVGMLAISAVGIIFSDIWPVKIIVELCLQRGSFIVTLLAGAIAAIYLWQKMHDGDLVVSLTATLALASLAAPSNGMAVLPWVVLAVLQWLRERQRRYAVAMIRLCVTLLLLTPIFIAEPTRILTGSAKMMHYLPVLGLLSSISILPRLRRLWSGAYDRQRPAAPWAIVLSLLVAIAIGRYETFAADQRAYGRMAPATLAAQSWARQHTAPDALFMVDPSFVYGWRDYAQRASFGTYREWGMFGFIYGGNAATYQEGLRRFALFGIDPVAIADDYEQRGLPLRQAARHIKSQVDRSYNNQSLNALFYIAKRERVDYLLIYSDRFGGDRGDAEPVYRNAAIEIYAVPPASRAVMRSCQVQQRAAPHHPVLSTCTNEKR